MEIIEFINDIFSTVSNRLFECQTIRVADGTSIDKETVLLAIPVKGLSEKDCEIYLIQDVKDAEGILFSFMMETIKECLEDIATTTERTQEIATVFAQDIYRRTCEKYIRFFNEKFHIMLDDIIAVSSMYYESEEAKRFILSVVPRVKMISFVLRALMKRRTVSREASCNSVACCERKCTPRCTLAFTE